MIRKFGSIVTPTDPNGANDRAGPVGRSTSGQRRPSLRRSPTAAMTLVDQCWRKTPRACRGSEAAVSERVYSVLAIATNKIDVPDLERVSDVAAQGRECVARWRGFSSPLSQVSSHLSRVDPSSCD